MIRYSIEPERSQEPVSGKPFHQFVFDDGTIWTEFYRSDDGYLLRFPGLADFDVTLDGKAVCAYPAPETGAATVEHLYLNQLVPLALSRQGRPTFHAGVVTVPGGAVAFLGGSGRGKSTLAASFAVGSAAFLTDDALIVEETDEAVLVLPSHASVRLREDSVEALVGSREQAPSHTALPQGQHVSYSSKARLLAGDVLAYHDEPANLLAAYVLAGDEPEEVTIAPLTGSERHMGWVENSFLLDIEDKDLIAQHFDWTHRISSRVPTFALDYPRDYGKLPEVHRAIIDHVSALV